MYEFVCERRTWFSTSHKRRVLWDNNRFCGDSFLFDQQFPSAAGHEMCENVANHLPVRQSCAVAAAERPMSPSNCVLAVGSPFESSVHEGNTNDMWIFLELHCSALQIRRSIHLYLFRSHRNGINIHPLEFVLLTKLQHLASATALRYQ